MEDLSLHLITYNVGTLSPQSATRLADLLPTSSSAVPDVVLVGLQEVNTSPSSLVVETMLSPTGEDDWSSNARRSLAKHGYVKIRSIKLLGIVLSLFVLEKHVGHLRGLETQYTRLGMNGYWGNKGTVSIRFSLYGVSICVLNSHLAAHDHQNEMRIQSYDDVLGTHSYSNKDTEAIMYHDYVFWMGDLNFRLGEDTFSFQEICHKVEKKQFQDLSAVDQLSTARKDGLAFSELEETTPTFPPTFKFKVGTDVYDAKRRPAWTDRILYKVNTGNYDEVKLKLEQDSYRSHQELLDSDHKPVTAGFRVSAFSRTLADKFLLPAFDPLVTFHVDELYLDEDNVVTYTVEITDIRHLASWDWIGVYRADSHSLENQLAFQWAPTTPVRDNAFEVFFDDAVFIRHGDYRLVYHSAGSKDIFGISPPIKARARDLEPELGVEVTEEL